MRLWLALAKGMIFSPRAGRDPFEIRYHAELVGAVGNLVRIDFQRTFRRALTNLQAVENHLEMFGLHAAGERALGLILSSSWTVSSAVRPATVISGMFAQGRQRGSPTISS